MQKQQLSPEQCKEIYSERLLHCGNILTLHCPINQLVIHPNQAVMTLSETQKRLMAALIKNITCKRQLINIVWHENHRQVRDNNYHQLVFQLRNVFQRHNVPVRLIETIPHYGLRLNAASLEEAFNNPTQRPLPKSRAGHANTERGFATFRQRLKRFFRSFLALSLLVIV